LKELGARPGQYIAIVGASGVLGSIAIQYARAIGLLVIAIDDGEEKGHSCKTLGAAAYIDFMKSPDLVQEVKAPVFDTVTRIVTIKGSYVGNR
jgi:propanol-preferring alcohol dehydrogenase